MNQEEILQAFLKKDHGFFSTIYTHNYPKLKYYILKKGGDAEVSKEIFQLAFTILYERVKLHKFCPNSLSDLEAYLFQIGKYKWIDYCKEMKKQDKNISLEQIQFWPEAEEAEALKSSEERIAFMQKTLEKMKEPCLSILKQFYYENLSYKEMEALGNYDASTLRTMKYRCLSNLKKIYFKDIS